MRPFLILLLGASAAFAQAPGRQKRAVTDDEVARVHRSALLIDTHNDITSATVAGLDIGKPNDRMTDLPRMKKGGMGAQFFAAYVASSYVEGNRAANRALQMIDTVRHDIVEAYPNDFVLALTADDIRRAHQQGKIAALIGIEGGHAIEDSLRLLRLYYSLGVRYMTLTHSNSNNWADSSGDPNKPHNGLTAFGKQVVAEMNRLGMIVDISHVADKTFWDALEVSKAPIFASHSSCRALSPVPRNMTDEMIAALGEEGRRRPDQLLVRLPQRRRCQAERRHRRPGAGRPRPSDPQVRRTTPTACAKPWPKPGASSVSRPDRGATLADVVQHINHVVKLAGVDAAGIGSDFDGSAARRKGSTASTSGRASRAPCSKRATPRRRSARFTARTRCA